MQDSVYPIEATFERWVAVSNAYEKSLLQMEHGDEGARAEVVRLAKELGELTEAMSSAPASKKLSEH